MSRGVVDLGDVSFLIMAAPASSEHHCDQISLTGTYVPECSIGRSCGLSSIDAPSRFVSPQPRGTPSSRPSTVSVTRHILWWQRPMLRSLRDAVRSLDGEPTDWQPAPTGGQERPSEQEVVGARCDTHDIVPEPSGYTRLRFRCGPVVE